MIANGLIMWLLAELANLSKNMTLSSEVSQMTV